MSDVTTNYAPTDRRPIASRDHAIWKAATKKLAAMRVSPNAISVVGMCACMVAGGLLAVTPQVGEWAARACWLGAAVLIPIRLICNMLDGMVAVERRIASPVGELYNEVPDRVSDIATFAGLGFAATSNPTLGMFAAALAVLVAYVRAAAKVAGAPQDYRGPMAKQQRMMAVVACCVAMAALPADVHAKLIDAAASVPVITLWVICAGSLLTAVRRLARASRVLRAGSATNT